MSTIYGKKYNTNDVIIFTNFSNISGEYNASDSIITYNPAS